MGEMSARSYVLREIAAAIIIFVCAPLWIMWLVITGALYCLSYITLTSVNMAYKMIAKINVQMRR